MIWCFARGMSRLQRDSVESWWFLWVLVDCRRFLEVPGDSAVEVSLLTKFRNTQIIASSLGEHRCKFKMLPESL